MAGTDFETLAPVAGDPAASYEILFDINTGTTATPVWTNVPEIDAFDPAWTDKLKTIQSYAYKGSDGTTKTGETFVLTVNVLKKRDPATQDFYPWYKALKARADKLGAANKIDIRWYDALGADEAYEATVAVSHPKRQNTGPDDQEVAQFTLTGDGAPVAITNPNASA